MPGPSQFDGRREIAGVNPLTALLVRLTIIPVLPKVDFGALHRVKCHWRGIGVTPSVERCVEPFTMALLGCLFVRGVFAADLPPDQPGADVAGLFFLAAIVLFRFNSGAALGTVVRGPEGRCHARRVRTGNPFGESRPGRRTFEAVGRPSISESDQYNQAKGRKNGD